MDGYEEYDTEQTAIRVFLKAGGQEVDLNCCFLSEESGRYYCRRDLDGEELVTCEDCQGATVFMNKRRKMPSLCEY